MNKTIFRTTLKQWCSSAGVISACGLYFMCLLGYTACTIIFTEWQLIEPSFVNTFFMLPFIFTLGTGILGKDISSGILSTLFSRPITRTKYVLAKWLALSVATSAIAIALALCEQTIVSVTYLQMPDVNLFTTIAERVSLCFGLSATMVGLSSIFTGNKNMVAWCILFGGMWILLQLATALPSMYFGGYFNLAWMSAVAPVVKALAEFSNSICLPWLDMTLVANTLIPSAATIFSYGFSVILMLTIAIWRMNNMEVSYAQQQ